MKIVVTLMDIAKAEEARTKINSQQACPIYQACIRKLGDKLLGVSRRYIWLKEEKDFLLPRVAVDATIAFDRGEKIKPFSFEV